MFAPMQVIRKIHRIFREIFIDPMPMAEFDDYDDYWKQRGHQEPKFRFTWISERLPDTGRLVDFGCGDGAFLQLVHHRHPLLELHGVDGSAEAIRKLADRQSSDRILGHLHDLNNPDCRAFSGFDVAVAMEIIEHLPEPEKLMRQIHQAGIPQVYITIPNMGFIVNRLRLALGGKTPVTAIVYHIKEHLRFWTLRDFHYWARQCGFEVVEYQGQNGIFGLWRILPSWFARQMIYVLRPIDG